MIPDLGWRDSYQTYAVRQDAEWVAFLPAAQFQTLPLETQQALLVAQGQLGRGQVYEWEQLAPLLHDDLRQRWASHRRFVTDAGALLALDAVSWRELPAAVRELWLAQFVSRQQAPYPTLHWEDIRWRRPPPRAATLRWLANRFPIGSGPNCFATALAAVTTDLVAARVTSALWLHPEPFLRGLAAHGFRTSDRDPSDISLSDAVLVWRDAAGHAQHACYVIGQGVALNKNAQVWYAPRHLARVGDILAYWSDDPFTVEVFVRDHRADA